MVINWQCKSSKPISIMNRFLKTTSRAVALCVVSAFSLSCAYTPDNWAFEEEIIYLTKVKRVALLDMPPPSKIWLGDPSGGGTAVFFVGPVLALAADTHSSDNPASGTFFSETTQKELKNWLEQAGVEVVLLKAERASKSKMLKDYNQFGQVDADVILEVGPIFVGFREDTSTMNFTDDELSPEVSYAFRVVSAKSKDLLIQSNVFYSSFYHYHRSYIAGVKLIGPKENIFEDEDSVREQPEEAIRRLQIAIREATKVIAKVVTYTYEEPVIESVPFTGNFSGTYIGLTSKGQPRPNSEVRIIQDGNKISGTYGNQGGKVWGDIEGDTISFDWTSPRGNSGIGKWKFTKGSSEVTGTYQNSYSSKNGKWNLRKIE